MTIGNSCRAYILRGKWITKSPFLVPFVVLSLHIFLIVLVYLSRSYKLLMLPRVPVKGSPFIRHQLIYVVEIISLDQLNRRINRINHHIFRSYCYYFTVNLFSFYS